MTDTSSQAHIRERMDGVRARGRKPRVGIIGLGYGGLPLVIAASGRGYEVIGFDPDEVKVAQLHQREAPFLSDEQNAQFKDAGDVRLTHDAAELRGVDILTITTPASASANEWEPDISPLVFASTVAGGALTDDTLVILESPVHPGACAHVVLPALSRAAGRDLSAIRFAHAPSPHEGRAYATTPRLVGGLTLADRDRAMEWYRAIIDATLTPMRSLDETEAVTLLQHAIADINAALVNELAIGFDMAGIDIVNVIEAAATLPHPFPALPGCGNTGRGLDAEHIMYGERRFDYRFLLAARRINTTMPLYAVKLLDLELQKQNEELDKAHVALLGLTRSGAHAELRGSPALTIHKELERRGARVRTFDPYAPAASSARTLRQALEGADAAIVAADHPHFKNLTPRHFEELDVSIVIDGTNCLDKDAFAHSGVRYRGIGRAP